VVEPPEAKADAYSKYMLSRQTPDQKASIVAKREAQRNHHRRSSLKYLRQSLLEESRWEEAQAAAASAQAAEAAALEAAADGERLAAVTPRRRSRREVERAEMADWLAAHAGAAARLAPTPTSTVKGVLTPGSWGLRGSGSR
jgi:hypothetical protein